MRILLGSYGGLRRTVLNALARSNHELVGYLADATTLWPGERVVLPFLWWLGDVIHFRCWRPLPLFWITRKATDTHAMEHLNPDLILVAGFRGILGEQVLRIPGTGCLNIHPSLLPRHRGPDPIPHVIRSGDRVTGISYHEMTSVIDGGKIVARHEFAVGDGDTADDVFEKVCATISETLEPTLERIGAKGIHGTPQEDGKADYEARLSEDDRRVRWEQSTEEILRLVRSRRGKKQAWFIHGEKRIWVAHASAGDGRDGECPGKVLTGGKNPLIQTGDRGVVVEVAAQRALGKPYLAMRWRGVRQGRVLK